MQQVSSKSWANELIILAIMAVFLLFCDKACAQTPSQPAQFNLAQLSLERVFANPALAGSTVRAPALSPDGRFITKLKARPDDQLRSDLWISEVETGNERLLVDSLKLSPAPAQLSEEELQRRERARLAGSRGIVEYRWAPDSKSILVPLDGDIYLVDLAGKSQRLTQTPTSEVDAKVSPQGRYVSYVRNQNFYVFDRQTNSERALTTDGGGALIYGMAEFVAQEEMSRTTGSWWAGDDARVVVARVDESGVAIATRTAIGADGTAVTNQRYPFAGTPNAHVSLHIYTLAGGAPVEVDLGADKDIYIARVNWLNATQFVVQRQNRAQNILDVLLIDAQTGRSRLLFQEQSKTWINLHDVFHVLDGAMGSFLWASERDGYQHLYRWDGKKLSQLTRGAFVVDQLLAVDEKRQFAYVSAFKDTPLEKHLYRVSLDGKGTFTRLTQPGGWHESIMARTGNAALITRATPSQPPQLYLADAEGKRLAWLNENKLDAGHPYTPYLAQHRAPEFGTIKASDGQEMYYSLLKPRDFDPSKRYPVFLEVYGGPGVARVQRTWMRTTPLHQYLSQQGWLVFMLDNRGATNRGVAFEAPLHLNLGQVEVADQLAGIAWLKAQPFVDANRIALFGWSYGGYMVARMMTQAPKLVAAGVSGAPVTDWRLYDTHYTERYLGNPATNAEPYDRSNVVRDADKLARPLLLIHGLADDNVVFDHSTKLMSALQRAIIPFETMVYPGQTHAIRDGALQTHLWQTILAFLNRHVLEGKDQHNIGPQNIKLETQQKPDAPTMQETARNNPVFHFEIPVTDLARARAFYEDVFGYSLNFEHVDGYAMAFFPRAEDRPGASGALAKGEVYRPTRDGAIIYFDVADIDTTLVRATKRGARILYEKKDIGAAGFVAEIEDSEGNRIGLTQVKNPS